MSPMLQSRLLRVLEEREVRRGGDNVPIYVNVRVLAATNEPLEERIKEGTFREDLYYRLNVIPITLPSLRERGEDTPLLVAHFLKDKTHPRTGQHYQMAREAMEVLLFHDWPGNVRELENAIERACTLCETNVIQVQDLPPTLHGYASKSSSDTVIETRPGAPPQSFMVLSESLYPLGFSEAQHDFKSAATPAAPEPIGSLKTFLRDQEVSYLNRALEQAGGDKEKAAQMLGISLATLYRKLSEGEEV